MITKQKFDGQEKTLLQIADLYGLDVVRSSRFEGGMINTSYCLELRDGLRVVMRIYQAGNRSNESIEKELEHMEAMQNYGISVPDVLPNKINQKLTLFEDKRGHKWQVILMSFIEGRHIEPADHDIIPEFALYQAKMHIASLQSGESNDKSDFDEMVDWLNKEFNESKSKASDKPIYTKITEIYEELKAKIKEDYEEIVRLPSGDVHLDYDSENVIVEGNKISAVIDFDDISNQPFVLDIANSIQWWLSKNDYKIHELLLNTYFENYQKIRTITKKEFRFMSLFSRMRNLTIICLLYINVSDEINIEKIEKGIKLDTKLKLLESYRYHPSSRDD